MSQRWSGSSAVEAVVARFGVATKQQQYNDGASVEQLIETERLRKEHYRTSFFTDPKWGNISRIKYNMQVIKQKMPDA